MTPSCASGYALGPAVTVIPHTGSTASPVPGGAVGSLAGGTCAGDFGARAPKSPAHVPPASEPTAPPGTGDAVDPVCGMTVTAGPSAYPLAHEGVTYYFCCAGCRGAFGKDPASYLRNETRC